MTGLPPEVAVLVIAFGLVLALGCYLVTNLSPGGMITPGWLALALIVEPRLAVVIAVVVVVTYFLCQALQRVVILYGKRLFATVVLVAVFFQLTAFMLFVQTAALYDVTTLGFIVPGLVAYQLIRQPAFATITATATVTMVAYCVTLGGVLLRLIPTEEQVAANGIAATPSEAFSSLQLALAAAGFVVVLAVIAVQMRRVRGAPVAEPVLEIGGWADGDVRVAGPAWGAKIGGGVAAAARAVATTVVKLGHAIAVLGNAIAALGRAAAAGARRPGRVIAAGLPGAWLAGSRAAIVSARYARSVFVPARRAAQPGGDAVEASTPPAPLVLLAPPELRTGPVNNHARAERPRGRAGRLRPQPGHHRVRIEPEPRLALVEHNRSRAAQSREAVRGGARQGFLAKQRSRETAFVLVGIAAAFMIHFGFGAPDESKSIRRDMQKPRAAVTEVAVAAGVLERTVKEGSDRRRKRSRAKRRRAKRAPARSTVASVPTATRPSPSPGQIPVSAPAPAASSPVSSKPRPSRARNGGRESGSFDDSG